MRNFINRLDQLIDETIIDKCELNQDCPEQDKEAEKLEEIIKLMSNVKSDLLTLHKLTNYEKENERV